MASTEGNRNEKRASSPLPEIPDKLYFRIGEAAKLLDLPTYVLRFWETEFPQLKPGKGGTGQRLYRRRDVELLLRIRGLLYDEGYTIPGARQHLKSESRGEPRGDSRAKEAAEAVADAEPVAEGLTASIRLRRMRSELREIASLLAGPTEVRGVEVPQASHRGLHLAPVGLASHGARRRPSAPRTERLFPDDESS